MPVLPTPAELEAVLVVLRRAGITAAKIGDCEFVFGAAGVAAKAERGKSAEELRQESAERALEDLYASAPGGVPRFLRDEVRRGFTPPPNPGEEPD